MSLENSLWGAPRIHGELLKLGIEVSQSTVAKYMTKRRRPGSSQTWQTFLRNRPSWPSRAGDWVHSQLSHSSADSITNMSGWLKW
jgi:hypothetical protein